LQEHPDTYWVVACILAEKQDWHFSPKQESAPDNAFNYHWAY